MASSIPDYFLLRQRVGTQMELHQLARPTLALSAWKMALVA